MVAGFVDVVSFLVEVVAPVGVEVAVGVDGAYFEDGFGAGESPSGSGDVHAVFDDVPARAFDDPGRYRPALLQSGRVAEVWGFAAEVGGGFLSDRAVDWWSSPGMLVPPSVA